MAERVTRKVKRQAPPSRQRSGRAALDSKQSGAGKEAKSDANGRFAALERERDQLKAQLSELRAQIVKLEQARDEAVGRIDWAIDSLHNVLESDA